MTKLTHTYRLTSCVLDNLKNYGNDGFKFILDNFKSFNGKNTIDHIEFTTEETISTLYALINCCKTYNSNTLIYLLQKNTNYICEDFPSINKNDDIVNYMFEISSKIFNAEKETILNKQNRDGRRVYASGTIAEHLMTFLNYDIKQTCEILNKNKSAISRHKKSISNLDFKHPTERKTLVKCLTFRYELVKFIQTNY